MVCISCSLLDSYIFSERDMRSIVSVTGKLDPNEVYVVLELKSDTLHGNNSVSVYMMSLQGDIYILIL